MARYRLTDAAQADIVSILAWSEEQFGEEARKRYEALIATAIRDAASHTGDVGHTPRPELGDGVCSGTWRRVAHAPRGVLSAARGTSSSVAATATRWSSAESSTTPWICDDTSMPHGLGIRL